MVTTRSMSGTTKKTDTKIAERETRKKNSNMKVTRAKSGTSKKVTKNAVKPREESVKGTRIHWKIKEDAFNLFMILDYLKRHYEKHPPRPTRGVLPDEVHHAGLLEWSHMSASKKAPWIEMAKNAKAQGTSVYSIRVNFYALSKG